MPRPHPVGTRRDTIPIPPVEEQTVRIRAGAVEFGVEYRKLTDDIISAHVSADAEQASKVAEARRLGGNADASINERGVSVHVFDSETGLEYLRFDAFEEDPHYHYISPGSHHVGVGFDEAANGDCLEWVLRVLPDRLPQMLFQAGASELADRVNMDSARAALHEVGVAATEAVRRQESVDPVASV